MRLLIELSKKALLSPSKLLKRSICILTLIFTGHFCALAQHATDMAKLKNYVKISEQLHTCGTIKTKDLEAIKSEGVNTVISLNTESPSRVIMLKGEAEALNIQYIHIPVSWERPSLESLQRFFKAMETNKNAEVLVHCRLNWRASAFTYLYQTLRLKADKQEALNTLHQVWKPERNEIWTRFIQEAEKFFQTK